MVDVLIDALIDTAKLFPFLLLSYILIELLEQKTDLGKPGGRLTGKLAPLIGGATGIIPQCGFSVMAAKLFDKKHITVGTLLAVFLATSDEALVILISSGAGAIAVMPLIAIKLVVAVGIGYAADLFFRKRQKQLTAIQEESDHAHCEHAHGEEREHIEAECCHSCGRAHDGKSKLSVYLWSPLAHTLLVTLFVFLVNFAFGTLFHLVGEEQVKAFLQTGLWIQPLIATLIGMIPNCASSVVLTQTYLVGGITFGSMIAGLCANAGLGLMVLFRNGKAWKRNLILAGALYAIGVAVGYAINAIMLACGLI